MKAKISIIDPRKPDGQMVKGKRASKIQREDARRLNQLRVIIDTYFWHDWGIPFVFALLTRFPSDYIFIDQIDYDDELLVKFQTDQTYHRHTGFKEYSTEAIQKIIDVVKERGNKWFHYAFGVFSDENKGEIENAASEDKFLQLTREVLASETLTDYQIFFSIDMNTYVLMCNRQEWFDDMIEFVETFTPDSQ